MHWAIPSSDLRMSQKKQNLMKDLDPLPPPPLEQTELAAMLLTPLLSWGENILLGNKRPLLPILWEFLESLIPLQETHTSHLVNGLNITSCSYSC